jgi:hypothetical protein
MMPCLEMMKKGFSMNLTRFANKMSFIVAFIALAVGFILFFSDTMEFMKSLAAAILLAVLVWISFIMVSWLVLAIRK